MYIIVGKLYAEARNMLAAGKFVAGCAKKECVAKFIVPYGGMKSTMALVYRTSPPAYVA